MGDQDLEEMSKPELVRELRKLRTAEERLENLGDADPKRLIQDLHVHQVQLEMQNRELREAQGLLVDSQNRYADLYDFAPVGYCTLDEKGRIQEINLTGAVLFGISREQLIGKPVSSLASIAGKDVFQSHVKKCFQEKARATGEVTLSVKGRGSVAVQLVSTPALDMGGAVTGCRTAITDISALKHLEARLRFLADVGEVVSSPGDYRGTIAALARLAVPFLADLCIVDLLEDDGSLCRFEVAFADAKNEADLADSVRYWAPRPGRRTPQERVVESGEPLLYEELQGSALNGVEQDAELAKAMRAVGVKSKMVVPLMARGHILGALTFAVAESDRRYSAADLAFAEEIARRAAMAMDNARLYALEQRGTRAREDLLAIVSHDLKNPLGSILMSVELVLRESAAHDERRKHGRKELQRIKHAADRMNALIRDLLDTASIAAGRIAVERARVAPLPVISESLDVLQPQAAAKSLRLETELSAELPAIFADPARLQQVFANLLGNAIKFTPDGGTITVRAHPSGDAVLFSVSDTGPGIPHDDLSHLFDRFWQAQRKARVGSGLGLFIVKGIVDAHGGRIWVDSEVGAGSTFFFTLPVAVEADRPDETPYVHGQPAVPLANSPDADVFKREFSYLTRVAPESAGGVREIAKREGQIPWDVLARVSHELRGPLTALELQLERMQRDRENPPSSRQQPSIQRMFAAVARMTATIESLLQYALLESGRLTTQIETFDVEAVAAKVADELRPYAEGKGLDVRFTIRSKESSLTSDPALTRLILLNLVENALKFTERGAVEISIDCTAAGCRLVVQDSGPGIRADDRARIFKAFAQLEDPPRLKDAPGLGLGLTIVQDVTAALGGHVELESEVGHGSTFTVILPSKPEASKAQHAPLLAVAPAREEVRRG
ncbi:MAG: PAS domain S-box protein [Planctomycetes bacterium]|nr:PAS domain S-box protein [Planctomycetota bacterium]